MAVVVRRGGLGRLLAGPRGGTTIMVFGLVLAVLSGVLVLRVARARQAQPAPTIPQVYVVVVTRDVAEGSQIPSDAVTVKPFPAAFAPDRAAGRIEDAAGKYAKTPLVRDQIVLTSQVESTRPWANLSDRLPPGKVGMWIPLPDLLTQGGGLRAGDRVNILLSLTVPGSQSPEGGGAALTTQTTLQDVEVFFVGAVGATPTGSGQAQQGGQGGQGGVSPGARLALLLVEPQDAVTAKFIKDSGGSIDFVLRSRDWRDAMQTEAVSAESLIGRFGFRPEAVAAR